MTEPVSEGEHGCSPLPWAADPDDRPGYEWNIHIVVANQPHLRVCFMANDPEKSQANAVLIVHSVNTLPELVRAIDDLITQYDFGPGHCLGVMSDGKACFKGSFLAKLENLRAALSKAKGE